MKHTTLVSWACVFVEVPVTIDYSHLEPGRKSKIVPILGWWSLLCPFLAAIHASKAIVVQ